MENTARILEDLRELVIRESPSDEADHVSALAAWICDRLNRGGGSYARQVPCLMRGDAVVATTGVSDTGQPTTLLLGHIDTVWPVGTLKELPFHNEAGVVRGPGVFDMKAGVAVALHVLDRLHARPSCPRVTLLLVPDEEVGSSASHELLIDQARKHDRVFVLLSLIHI